MVISLQNAVRFEDKAWIKSEMKGQTDLEGKKAV